MAMVTWVETVSHSRDGLLVALLFILFFCMVVDTLMGTILNLVQNTFSSFKMKIGILIKISQLALTIFVLIPLGVFIGSVEGFGAFGVIGVYGLLVAFIIGELYSVLGHLKLVDDKSNWLGVFENFLKSLTKK